MQDNAEDTTDTISKMQAETENMITKTNSLEIGMRMILETMNAIRIQNDWLEKESVSAKNEILRLREILSNEKLNDAKQRTDLQNEKEKLSTRVHFLEKEMARNMQTYQEVLDRGVAKTKQLENEIREIKEESSARMKSVKKEHEAKLQRLRNAINVEKASAVVRVQTMRRINAKVKIFKQNTDNELQQTKKQSQESLEQERSKCTSLQVDIMKQKEKYEARHNIMEEMAQSIQLLQHNFTEERKKNAKLTGLVHRSKSTMMNRPIVRLDQATQAEITITYDTDVELAEQQAQTANSTRQKVLHIPAHPLAPQQELSVYGMSVRQLEGNKGDNKIQFNTMRASSIDEPADPNIDLDACKLDQLQYVVELFRNVFADRHTSHRDHARRNGAGDNTTIERDAAVHADLKRPMAAVNIDHVTKCLTFLADMVERIRQKHPITWDMVLNKFTALFGVEIPAYVDGDAESNVCDGIAHLPVGDNVPADADNVPEVAIEEVQRDGTLERKRQHIRLNHLRYQLNTSRKEMAATNKLLSDLKLEKDIAAQRHNMQMVRIKSKYGERRTTCKTVIRNLCCQVKKLETIVLDMEAKRGEDIDKLTAKLDFATQWLRQMNSEQIQFLTCLDNNVNELHYHLSKQMPNMTVATAAAAASSGPCAHVMQQIQQQLGYIRHMQTTGEHVLFGDEEGPVAGEKV